MCKAGSQGGGGVVGGPPGEGHTTIGGPLPNGQYWKHAYK